MGSKRYRIQRLLLLAVAVGAVARHRRVCSGGDTSQGCADRHDQRRLLDDVRLRCRRSVGDLVEQRQEPVRETYPGAHLKLQGFDGTDVDLVNKVALLYKSSSTTPDVFMLPTGYVGQWVASNYLAPLDKYLTEKNAPFWKSFPKVIQNESRIKGHVYAINTGENDSAIYYNKAMLRKAGIKLPWHPKTWAQIMAAAKKVKAANSGVVPLWAAAGTSAGAGGVLQGSANLVLGSKTPTIFDTKTDEVGGGQSGTS